MKFENANVLITGGASGIGKIMGRMALEKGAKCFIIWDINMKGIDETCKELSQYGNVKGFVVDVSRNDVVQMMYDKTVEECGDIDILINCAGIITSNTQIFLQCISKWLAISIYTMSKCTCRNQYVAL